MPLPRPSRCAVSRLLLRPRVVTPVVVVAVLLGAFLGYGAWTRSRAVSYARGGADFAVVPTGSPTPSTVATAVPQLASAQPLASPAASARSTAPALTDAGTAGSPSPGPRPAPGLVLPHVGRYGLRVEGSERVDFGPVSFCSQDLPSETSLVVSKAAGEGPTSFDFDVPYFPDSTGKHDERHVYRYTPAGVYLDYEIATVTCQGVRQSSDTSYSPPQLRVRLPLATGTSWTNEGGDADREEKGTSRVVRTEVLAVAGQQVLTYVIQTTITISGSESGGRTQTWWWSPAWAVPVKWSEHIEGRRSGASYSEDVTVTVTSRP